ncbi:hypothetical protein D3C71_1808590 [compost metagenome]
MLKDKLAIEVDRLNAVNEEYNRIQTYLQNLDKQVLVINGRIQILNELIIDEQNNSTQVEEQSNPEETENTL